MYWVETRRRKPTTATIAAPPKRTIATAEELTSSPIVLP